MFVVTDGWTKVALAEVSHAQLFTGLRLTIGVTWRKKHSQKLQDRGQEVQDGMRRSVGSMACSLLPGIGDTLICN